MTIREQTGRAFPHRVVAAPQFCRQIRRPHLEESAGTSPALVDMKKTTIACAASNFSPGRPTGIQPEAIVLHRTGGTADQTRIRFLDAATVTSAHYFVGTDG